MSISWEFKELEKRKQFNSEPDGFLSKGDAKSHVKENLANLSCSSCGNRKLDGQGVLINITRVDVYDQFEKKGLFGTSIKEKFRKTVFVVDDPQLKEGGFFGGGGFIKCMKCGNKAKAFNSFWGQWAKNIGDAHKRGEI
jgi:transcription elongation factor Elf1